MCIFYTWTPRFVSLVFDLQQPYAFLFRKRILFEATTALLFFFFINNSRKKRCSNQSQRQTNEFEKYQILRILMEEQSF